MLRRRLHPSRWVEPLEADRVLEQLAANDSHPLPERCSRPLRVVAALPKGARPSWFPYPDSADPPFGGYRLAPAPRVTPPSGRCRAADHRRPSQSAHNLCFALMIAGEPTALCRFCAPGLDRYLEKKGALF